jgi:hypothetical protein
MRAFLLYLVPVVVMAQTPPPTAGVNLSGVVRDWATGAPMERVNVNVLRGTDFNNSRNAETDVKGNYLVRDLAPGIYRVRATAPSTAPFGAANATKQLTIRGGDVTGFDLRVQANGEISGKVTDKNGEPVPGARVALVAREYLLGALRHVFAKTASTDDRGNYSLTDITPGKAYLLVAMQVKNRIDAISDVPVSAEFRRKLNVPTYYPGVTSRGGAEAFLLRPGERRERIDIRMESASSFCLTGVFQSGLGPGPSAFRIEDRQVSSGASGNGALYVGQPTGITDNDGKFRICELYPGDYRIYAFPYAPASREIGAFGVVGVTVTNQDIDRVTIAASPLVTISGEVVWDGKAPEPPISTTLNVGVDPLVHSFRSGRITRPTMPGTFTMENLVMDELVLAVNGIPDGVYVKDIVYGINSTFRKPFRPGSAMTGSGLRIVLASDGGKVQVRTTDKDGRTLGDTAVAVVPVSSASEAELAAAMVIGRTDQSGSWISGQLAPGKYYVFASAGLIDPTPESIGRLWSTRAKAVQAEIVNGGVQVEVKVE